MAVRAATGVLNGRAEGHLESAAGSAGDGVAMSAMPLLLLCAALGAVGCAPPRLSILPARWANGAPVRVIVPRLGGALQPGKAVLSHEGCWTVAVAGSDIEPIVVLRPDDLSRVQMSREIPQPVWWAGHPRLRAVARDPAERSGAGRRTSLPAALDVQRPVEDDGTGFEGVEHPGVVFPGQLQVTNVARGDLPER